MALITILLQNAIGSFLKMGLFSKVLTVLAVMAIIYRIKKMFFTKHSKNPFSKNCVQPKRAFVHEKEKRDAVLKQGFTSKNIPQDLDAIVIGSGIGGLSCAAILAKSGQKVLVLEQHDQAGGCCHSFIEKGYEFDVGIHYIGEVSGNTLTKTYVDQITDGQLEFAQVEDCIDQVELGSGDDHSTHRMLGGKDVWKNELKKDFPNEHKAIDQFFKDMRVVRKNYAHTFILKILPLWLVNIVLNLGLFGLFSKLPKYLNQTLSDYVDGLTSDKRLKAAMCYSFGDYGTQPGKTPAMMQLMLLQHYSYGGYYPVGGSSEIAFNIIPVIERSGGKVLVRAPVTKILLDANGATYGVSVTKGGENIKICAPKIISAAGVFNTYNSLLPKSEASKMGALKKVNSGVGAMSIFVGLDGSNEELGLKATNTWAFTDVDLDRGFDEYIALPAEEVGKSDIPLLFISFPSTKDPTWDERYPGKSNCTIVTLANWNWFSNWKDKRIMKRGDDYEELKKRIGDKIWEQTLRYYPQLKGKVKYFDVGTPLTNNYYIAAPKGEIYGADHTIERFQPSVMAQLRPQTSIPGLYLTGQDISTAGFAGALYAGLLTASTILDRNLMNDLISVLKEVRQEKSKKQE